MKINKEVVGDRIRTLIEDKGATIYDLAELTHLSAATISRYVNGLMSPKITTIEIIATRYGVNPAWLMGMSDKKALPANAVKLQSARIPLLGTIAAGKPILAEENIEEYIDVDTLTKADFCLKIEGDSMTNAGMNDGDIVFIRNQEDVENGEIAAVLIGDMDTYETLATLKRVYKTEQGIQLVSENPKYPPMFFNSENSLSIRIIGKATYLLSQVK